MGGRACIVNKYGRVARVIRDVCATLCSVGWGVGGGLHATYDTRAIENVSVIKMVNYWAAEATTACAVDR